MGVGGGGGDYRVLWLFKPQKSLASAEYQMNQVFPCVPESYRNNQEGFLTLAIDINSYRGLPSVLRYSKKERSLKYGNFNSISSIGVGEVWRVIADKINFMDL